MSLGRGCCRICEYVRRSPPRKDVCSYGSVLVISITLTDRVLMLTILSYVSRYQVVDATRHQILLVRLSVSAGYCLIWPSPAVASLELSA